MVDGLQIDVFGEIEVTVQAVERIAPLLVGHRAGQDIDAVPRDCSDHEIAAMFELWLTELLRLAVHLAAVRDADVGGEEEVGRVGAG